MRKLFAGFLVAVILLGGVLIWRVWAETNIFCASNLPCTVSGAWTYSSQLVSSMATGTAPFSIASTTVTPNLNAALLNGATFAAPGPIGGTTPGSGAFTTVSASGQITSTVSTGTAPLVVASTTQVANLNASRLGGLNPPASAIVGLTDSQALTSKTLTSPVITTPSITSPTATGAAVGVTGTGACATVTNVGGGSWAGSFKCTGTTGAATVTITFGLTAPLGCVCTANDLTTRANLLQQTAQTGSSCVLTATSVTQNDVFTFLGVAF